MEEAQYYHSTVYGGFRRHGCENTEENRETLRQVLTTVDALVTTGTLLPDPDEDNCRFCLYVDICGPDREPRAERKSADPRSTKFRALRQIP